ncbi:MAG: hypothetical protein H0T66_14150 [Geodermatophilaceae bacterium]|nr:hypothetical protein [Geodermatophilaceae bacterium]MDQ3457447.1 hypothetical protein [Actinomycetota bacterium]
MKRLVTLTSTDGKTPEQVAAVVTANVATYQQAEERAQAEEQAPPEPPPPAR